MGNNKRERGKMLPNKQKKKVVFSCLNQAAAPFLKHSSCSPRDEEEEEKCSRILSKNQQNKQTKKSY